jgi:hypothetical protein
MKFRLLCFGSHLLVSLLIAILSVGLVFWLWYPSPLDKALGVANIFLLLLSIDVIVGPLLTLIVAKQGKKTLKMDLLTIGVVQLMALSYGVYVVAQGRPVWMIYDTERFELVQAYEAVAAPKNSPSPGGLFVGLTGPVWGAVIEEVPAAIIKGDAYYRAEFLQAYDAKIASKVAAHSRPFGVLKIFNDPAKVDAILAAYPEADAYVPMAAKEKSLCVLVNKAKGEPIAIVDLSPW